MNKQGLVKRCLYRGIGPMNNVDALVAEVEVDGETHEHPYPNRGWSYQTPALLFLGYLEKKPTDIEGTSFEVDDVSAPIMWSGDQQQYLIDDQALKIGRQFLKGADWFEPEGDVYDSDENQGAGGMNVEPGTGNQGTVEIEAENE
jgi:hypothetical protein